MSVGLAVWAAWHMPWYQQMQHPRGDWLHIERIRVKFFVTVQANIFATKRSEVSPVFALEMIVLIKVYVLACGLDK